MEFVTSYQSVAINTSKQGLSRASQILAAFRKFVARVGPSFTNLDRGEGPIAVNPRWYA